MPKGGNTGRAKMLYEPTRAQVWEAISRIETSEVAVCADIETVAGKARGHSKPFAPWTARPVGVSLGDGCFARTPKGEE